MSNNESLKYLDWDSRFFDRPIYQFTPKSEEQVYTDYPEPCEANDGKETTNLNGVRHSEHSEGSPDVMEMSRKARHDVLFCEHLPEDCLVQCKIPSSAISLIDRLKMQGFSFVESEVLFQKPLAVSSGSQRIYEPISPQDIEALCELAAEVFIHTRFREPWFTQADASRLYRQWVKNAIDQSFDDICLMEFVDKRAAGFVTARMLDQKHASIGLIGTNPSFRGKGYGKILLQRIETWSMEQGADTLCVATQGSNSAAMQLYLRQGYLFKNLSYWFYKQL